jgi:cobalt/nickel transport system permease protein
MHIYEGILTGTPEGQAVLVAGAAVAAVGTAIGLAEIDDEKIPQVAVLSAAFFVISSIHVPLGPTSEHLLLTGLMGLVLGWAAFPAVLVALLLQTVFFSFGGWVTLGLNVTVMALPAVACRYLFQRAVQCRGEGVVFAAGFVAGATAILLAALLNVGALWISGGQFHGIAVVVAALHLPLMAVEGFVTGSVIVLLRKVRPELLDAPLLARS